MKLYIYFLSVLLILTSCNQQEPKHSYGEVEEAGNFVVEIALENTTPTVDMAEFTLIGNEKGFLKDDAIAIMNVKRRWPLAVQSQNEAEFESILARDFSFKGIGEFFNRKDYIQNRIKPDDWKITFVKYENVSLQFIGELGVLTYKNKIKNENTITQETEIEIISWMDIFVKENNQWKIRACHAIDYKAEK